MSNRKKQSVAAAMATVIGVGTLISPVAVHAQEEVPPTAITQETAVNSTQENDSSIQEKEKGESALLIDNEYKNEIDTMQSFIQKNAGDAFTDVVVAKKAIVDALKSYEFSNETTQQEIQNFLNQQFVDTGKLKEIPISSYSVSTNATTTNKGVVSFDWKCTLINGHSTTNQFFQYVIPRLPKEGEVAINSKNFPDPIFKKYVKDNFDTVSDGVLSADEINQITEIRIDDRTDITSLKGIEYFTALNILYCSRTGITSLDVSNNKALTKLTCYNTKIKSLNVKKNTELTTLMCDRTEIENLDVNLNTKLTKLRCFGTKIQSLDVSSNTKLTDLYCYNNASLKNLKVDGAVALTILQCHDTVIENLDVSKNTKLTELVCYNTKIENLDVSHNIALTHLDCSNTPLAYLNIGVNNNLTTLGKESLSINVEVTDESFNITDKFAGINKGKISNVTGADYNNGIMSNYSEGIPIMYTYDCGTSGLGKETINVTLNLTDTRTDSIIVVTANLDKIYDGTAVSTYPSITKNGSTGEVSYKWEKKVSDTLWEVITYVPKDAGTYRVTATLASDNNYKGATSEPFEFIISQADSAISITEDLSKAYDGKTVNTTPTVNKTGSKGAVSYKWERKMNATEWESISSAPTDAGIYRVIAIVVSDNNYKGATSEPFEFIISQADSAISITEDLSKAFDGKTVNTTPTVNKTGSKGAVSYKWEQKMNATEWESISSAPTDAGIYRVTAIVVSDKNYKEATSTPVEFTISQADSTISITEDLSKAFDGKTVNTTPTVNKTGSKGAVSYKWEQKMNATEWENISSAPTDVGTYRVTAKVDADDNYKGEISDTKEFTIVQASNSWIDNLTITGWTYGDKAVSPSAKANFGTVIFTYSDSKNGAYTTSVPTNAGTWYVKATVADSDNYNGLESIISFTISSKSAENNNQIVIPDINSDKDVEKLVIKDVDKELIEGNDYDVEKKQDNNKVTVTITFKGNYVGTVIKTYTVNVDEPKEEQKETVSTPTGDHSYMGLFATMSLLSAGCIAFLTGKKKGYEK